MIINNIYKSYVEKIASALKELRQQIITEIINEDPLLFQLSFVKDIPCALKEQITREQAEDLWEEILSLEADAYDRVESRMNDPVYAKPFREREEYYRRFDFLKGLLCYFLENGSD